MASVTRMLPRKDPAESVVVGFDFTGELAVIDAASVSISVVAGTDALPAAVLSGSPQIRGSQVLQRIQGGIDQCNYLLRCVANHGADAIVRSGVLPVRIST